MNDHQLATFTQEGLGMVRANLLTNSSSRAAPPILITSFIAALLLPKKPNTRFASVPHGLAGGALQQVVEARHQHRARLLGESENPISQKLVWRENLICGSRARAKTRTQGLPA